MSISCGTENDLRENIYRALTLEGLSAEVTFHRVNDIQAASLGLHGSPSVLIDGKDIQPANITGFS